MKDQNHFKYHSVLIKLLICPNMDLEIQINLYVC